MDHSLLFKVEEASQDGGDPLNEDVKRLAGTLSGASRSRQGKSPNLPPEPVGAVGGAATQALGGIHRGVGAYSRNYRRQAHVACCPAQQRASLLQEIIAGRRDRHDG